jgi:hypothetical protein
MNKNILSRLLELGAIGLYNALRRRLRAQVWRLRMRRKALAGTAGTTWRFASFAHFFRQLQYETTLRSMLLDPQFRAWLPSAKLDPMRIKQDGDEAVAHRVDLLGSGPITLWYPINWHHEFKKEHLRPPFTTTDTSFSYADYARTFHTDIPVPQRSGETNVYHEDIKVLWDLGRMHHLSTLGHAYTTTHDERYTAAFKQDIESFMDQVPYLIGPHWKCPMDVGIRAINLVWALHFFKQSLTLDLEFWQRYSCMLYDHMTYLAHNWEESDKPNNHLLTDYVGYLYLAVLFRTLPGGQRRLRWIKKTMTAGFMHQILADGAAYEGSTAYHRLDCELLLHATTLLRTIGQPVPALENSVQKMLTFFSATIDQGGNLATIGDDDSGSIVFGLAHKPGNPGIKFFPNFGVGILRTNRLHATLRAPAHTAHRPTGHIHHDALSITLSINGHPVLIDPGSFVYTANTAWRHFFKAPPQHSTLFFDTQSQQSADLFQTTLTHTAGSLTPLANGMEAACKVNAGTLRRSVRHQDNTLIIQDVAAQQANELVRWRFVLHPAITVTRSETGYWLAAQTQQLAHIACTHPLQLKHDAAYAPAYGLYQPTQALECSLKTNAAGITITTTITLCVTEA